MTEFDLRADLFKKEKRVLAIIGSLNEQAKRKGADSVECVALSNEIAKTINRWRRTASLSVEGLTAIMEEMRKEAEYQQQLEQQLFEKEEILERLWNESKVFKTSISMLEEKLATNSEARLQR